MDNRLKPYEQYTESEVSYINSYPSHWETTKLRFVFAERKEKNTAEKETNILSVMKNRGVIPYSEKGNVGNKHSEDIERYKLVYEDDIVMNSMNVIIGSVGRSKYNGTLSPVYYVLKNRNNLNYNTKYFENIFRMTSLQRELIKYGKGILAHRMRIPFELLKNIDLPLPPKKEQDQIVRYLDWKLAKINKFIKAKKKQIEILKEQKQEIINEAVTKGLDPNEKMRPSGIEWLGDIPEKWEIRRLKSICRINPTVNLSKYSIDDMVAFLPMEKISEYGKVDNSELRKISEVKSGFTSFGKNDVVVAKITPCFENGKGACLVDLITDIGYGTTELIVLRSSDKVIPKFLYYITRTSYFRILGAEVMTGSAGQKRVPVNFVSNFTLGIPDIQEQLEILTYIEANIQLIDNTINKIDNEIKLIMEYRTSLISDLVTGKVDVRSTNVEDLSDVIEENEELEEIEETNGIEDIEETEG